MQKVRLITNQQGFSIVEALLAASILGMLVMAVVGSIAYSREAQLTTANRTRANMLADEGTEAVRNIRDAAFANVTNGTFGLVQSGNQWVLSGTSDTSGIYTRQIIISTPSANRKEVISRVSWQQGSRSFQTETTARLTNWLATVVPPTSWNNAIQTATLDMSGTLDAIKVKTAGNYAYVVRGGTTPGFNVVDVTNPSSPTVVGSLNLPSGTPTNLFVSGNYAYVSANDTSLSTASGVGELKIINISNPAAPTIAGSLNLAGTAAANSISVSGNFVYIVRNSSNTTNSNEFTAINISNPATPTLADDININIDMFDIYINGTVAYVTTESNSQEVYVVNISNPSALTTGTHLNLPSGTNASTINGTTNSLIVVQGNDLSMISLSAPLAPARVGGVTLSSNANDITINEAISYAYVGGQGATNEFQVINFSTLASPTIVRSVDLAGTLPILGVTHSSTHDRVFGVTGNNTQEFMVFAPN